MKTLTLLLSISLLSTQVLGQAIAKDRNSTSETGIYVYKYAPPTVAKVGSVLSLASGSALLFIGIGKELANGVDWGMDINSDYDPRVSQLISELMSYVIQSDINFHSNAGKSISKPTWNYEERRKTKQYFISGSVLIGLGVILDIVDEKSEAGRNSGKMYRHLKANSSRDGLGVVYKF